MQIYKQPTKPFQIISINFIVKLLKSKELITEIEYNLIFVVICRLIKYIYFLLYLKFTTVKDLSYWFLRNIVANHRILEEIVSNRDKLFILNFWKSLIV